MVDIVKSVNIALGEDVPDQQQSQTDEDKKKSLVLDI